MPKIALSLGDNLGKPYSKYESHPWMFVTVRPNIVEAERRRKKKNKIKKKKKLKKKKSEEKNLGRNYKTSRPTDGMPKYEHDELNVKLGNTCFIFILWHRNLCWTQLQHFNKENGKYPT